MQIIETEDGKKAIQIESADVELGVKDNDKFWEQLNELSERLKNESQSTKE